MRDDVSVLSQKTRPVRARRMLTLLATAAYICISGAALAQTPDSQASDSKSWTTASDSTGDSANPTRSSQSHTVSGNRTVDVQSLQVRGIDGSFRPFEDIETETVQVNATTTRVSTRTFVRDADGAKTLSQVTEEDRQTLPGGNSNVVRTISTPGTNGNLQLVEREVQDTTKTGPDSQETKTTVMLPDISGAMAPSMQTQERQKRNGDTVEIQKTTTLPDGAGSWRVIEIRQSTVMEDGTNRSTDERVSRPDVEGKLTEVSRTVRNELGNASGEKRKSEETYSGDVPGVSSDGSLHMVQRVTTTQHTTSAGQQTSRVEERHDLDATGGGLQMTAVTTDKVSLVGGEPQATQTVQVPDGAGNLNVIFVDMTKSNNANAIEVQIGPSKPK